ncbi:MAG: PEP-CTERM sorting domain-containing protein [Verrucomicrobiota bacterium]
MKLPVTSLHSFLTLTAVAALTLPASAQITGYDVDFNSGAADYTDNFQRFNDSAVGDTGLNWGAGVGTGGGGGLIVTETSARNIFYRPSPASDATSTFDMTGLGASDVFSTSLDFRWADTTSTSLTVITAGFTPANSSQTALTSSGALAGSIIRNLNSTVTLRIRNGNANAATLDFSQSALTAGSWYRLGYDLIRSETADTFTYSVSLFSIGADGTSGEVLFNDGAKDISITGSVTNSAIYNDTDAFFAYDIRGGTSGISHADNFVVGAAIPEPSTASFVLGGVALASVAFRRRRHA